jgi:two-component system LytT family sensor kinase
MASSGQQGFMDNRDASPDSGVVRVRIRPAVVLAAWAMPALLSSFQRWASASLGGHPASFWQIAATEWPGWLVWAVFTPFIFRVAERFPLRRPIRPRDVAVHGMMWIGCIVGHALVVSRDFGTNGSNNSYVEYVGFSAIAWLPSTFLLYVATVGAALWMQALQRAQQRERERALMSVELARAELSTLRSQLHPHFLFNTLNTIAILIRERDTEVAARLVTQLGDLLRRVLQGTRTNVTSLDDEIALVATYLDIEAVRFGDRLAVRWLIDADVRFAEVPSLVLQPLVENALRHAVAQRVANGLVEVGATRRALNREGAERGASELVLWISDNGADAGSHEVGDSRARTDGGVGLRNTRERLSRLYPACTSLELVATPGGGTRAEVRMPFREWSAA